jgi:ferredoxin
MTRNNVVVDAAKCNFCMSCIAPCPTGSIDNWRVVAAPYSLEEQLSWMELPEQEDLAAAGEGASGVIEALDDEVAALLAEAHKGAGGAAKAPASASKPSVNLFTNANPAIATVQGNYRLTAETRRRRRPPHHPRPRFHAVSGAGGPERRHRAARARRAGAGRTACGSIRSPRRATASGRTPTICR